MLVLFIVVAICVLLLLMPLFIIIIILNISSLELGCSYRSSLYIYVYVIGRFPVVFGINSASSAVFEGSKIARGVAECYFPSKTALRELFIPNNHGCSATGT